MLHWLGSHLQTIGILCIRHGRRLNGICDCHGSHKMAEALRDDANRAGQPRLLVWSCPTCSAMWRLTDDGHGKSTETRLVTPKESDERPYVPRVLR